MNLVIHFVNVKCVDVGSCPFVILLFHVLNEHYWNTLHFFFMSIDNFCALEGRAHAFLDEFMEEMMFKNYSNLFPNVINSFLVVIALLAF